MRNLMKIGLVALALNWGACSSDSGVKNNTGTGGAGGSGGSSATGGSGGSSSTGGSGGSSSTGGTGGSNPDGGTDAPGTGGSGALHGSDPTTCANAGSAQAINDCITNLTTDSVGQDVVFTPAADYTLCKMP
jgi:hypothetical protein